MVSFWLWYGWVIGEGLYISGGRDMSMSGRRGNFLVVADDELVEVLGGMADGVVVDGSNVAAPVDFKEAEC